MLIKYIIYITFGFKDNTGQVNICVCIFKRSDDAIKNLFWTVRA